MYNRLTPEKAYQKARAYDAMQEEMLSWKERALEAESKLQQSTPTVADEPTNEFEELRKKYISHYSIEQWEAISECAKEAERVVKEKGKSLYTLSELADYLRDAILIKYKDRIWGSNGIATQLYWIMVRLESIDADSICLAYLEENKEFI